MVWSGSEKSDQMPVTRKQTKGALLLYRHWQWLSSFLKPLSIFTPSNVTWTECYHYHWITFYLPSSGGWWCGTGCIRCRRWTSTPLPHLRSCQCEDNESWCMMAKKDGSWLDQHKSSHVDSGSQISVYACNPIFVWPTEAETIFMATVKAHPVENWSTVIIWWPNFWLESKIIHEFSNTVTVPYIAIFTFTCSFTGPLPSPSLKSVLLQLCFDFLPRLPRLLLLFFPLLYPALVAELLLLLLECAQLLPLLTTLELLLLLTLFRHNST